MLSSAAARSSNQKLLEASRKTPLNWLDSSGTKITCSASRTPPGNDEPARISYIPVTSNIDGQRRKFLQRHPSDLIRKSIDLVLHTLAVLVLAATQIAQRFSQQSKVTVFVPHYAMSRRHRLALAADEIVMSDDAVPGPVDPQLGEYPAASVLKRLIRTCRRGGR